MLKTKLARLVALVLCVVVLVVSEKTYAASNELYLEALDNEVVSSVRKYTAEVGDFIVSSTVKGRLTTQDSVSVFNEFDIGEVEFVTYTQFYGTFVKEGDDIAKVKVRIDDIKYNEIKLRLERAKANLEKYITDNEELLKEYELASKVSSGAQQELAILSYEKLQKTYEVQKSEREEEISKLEEEYEKYKEVANSEYVYIKAPCSGITGDYIDYSVGDKLEKGDFIASVYDISKVMVYVTNTNNNLRYDMPVTITQARGSKTSSLDGTVISCNNSPLTNDLKSPYDLILVEGDISKLSIAHEVTVLYQSKKMENALMIPKNALLKDDNGTYVNLLIDGKLTCKRYVISAAENIDKAWIIAGLEEGDTVIVK